MEGQLSKPMTRYLLLCAALWMPAAPVLAEGEAWRAGAKETREETAVQGEVSAAWGAGGVAPLASYREAHPPLSKDYKEEDLRRARRRWWYSVLALAAANAMDAHSSWGKRERNVALRNGEGTFGARGAGVKLGIVAGALLVQRLAADKEPQLLPTFTYMNYAMSAAFAGTAAHNYRLPRAEGRTPQRTGAP